VSPAATLSEERREGERRGEGLLEQEEMLKLIFSNQDTEIENQGG
jgi:hypothetical protein